MSNWPYFSEVHEDMDPDFMERLIALREFLDFALPVTSSLRTKAYNARVGGSKYSAHIPDEDGKSHAVDIHIYGEKAFKLIEAAFKFGFTGIGVRQRGKHRDRFVHLDNCKNSRSRPRPRFWTS